MSFPQDFESDESYSAPPESTNLSPFSWQDAVRLRSVFPVKLYQMLEEVDKEIVDWLPHGKAFKILQVEKFTNDILPQYFKHHKLESFTRQLNSYGFKKMTIGPSIGSYFHQFFQKGRVDLLPQIKVRTVKKTPSNNTNTKKSMDSYENDEDLSSASMNEFQYNLYAFQAQQQQQQQQFQQHDICNQMIQNCTVSPNARDYQHHILSLNDLSQTHTNINQLMNTNNTMGIQGYPLSSINNGNGSRTGSPMKPMNAYTTNTNNTTTTSNSAMNNMNNTANSLSMYPNLNSMVESALQHSTGPGSGGGMYMMSTQPYSTTSPNSATGSSLNTTTMQHSLLPPPPAHFTTLSNTLSNSTSVHHSTPCTPNVFNATTMSDLTRRLSKSHDVFDMNALANISRTTSRNPSPDKRPPGSYDENDMNDPNGYIASGGGGGKIPRSENMISRTQSRTDLSEYSNKSQASSVLSNVLSTPSYIYPGSNMPTNMNMASYRINSDESNFGNTANPSMPYFNELMAYQQASGIYSTDDANLFTHTYSNNTTNSGYLPQPPIQFNLGMTTINHHNTQQNVPVADVLHTRSRSNSRTDSYSNNLSPPSSMLGSHSNSNSFHNNTQQNNFENTRNNFQSFSTTINNNNNTNNLFLNPDQFRSNLSIPTTPSPFAITHIVGQTPTNTTENNTNYTTTSNTFNFQNINISTTSSTGTQLINESTNTGVGGSEGGGSGTELHIHNTDHDRDSFFDADLIAKALLEETPRLSFTSLNFDHLLPDMMSQSNKSFENSHFPGTENSSMYPLITTNSYTASNVGASIPVSSAGSVISETTSMLQTNTAEVITESRTNSNTIPSAVYTHPHHSTSQPVVVNLSSASNDSKYAPVLDPALLATYGQLYYIPTEGGPPVIYTNDPHSAGGSLPPTPMNTTVTTSTSMNTINASNSISPTSMISNMMTSTSNNNNYGNSDHSTPKHTSSEHIEATESTESYEDPIDKVEKLIQHAQELHNSGKGSTRNTIENT